MRRKHRDHEQQQAAGFTSAPDDSGLSIDRLAQAFAAMMGQPHPAEPPPADEVVKVDASPDLDDEPGDDACRVGPLSILEALLFVGLPGGEPLSSATVAGLMRGVRPQEIDALAAELAQRYEANNCPYQVASQADGWLLRLRPEFARFGAVLERRTRQVRLDAESLDALALVAWHQPVPRDRLVELGCDARPATLRALVRRGLLALEQPIEPDAAPAYVTTPKFLQVFKLESLADLPPPHEPPG
ncbi:MAG: SMC-Scp complex subunit ScpB [Planctomycetota bacterium]|jgi:segregation and condensation protein B|nr:SMC-Scp complex subunit ScpB [Planctomycetota bacterium]MDA1201365.1 SMC-Scp complex subunit ScpB [Planctomycetota bacterium]